MIPAAAPTRTYHLNYLFHDVALKWCSVKRVLKKKEEN